MTAAPLRAHPVSVLGEIDTEAAEQADLVGIQLSGSRPPLFLIRTWTGEVANHRRLAHHLGPEQPIYSFAPPRGTKPEDFPKDAQEWAERVLAQVLEVPHHGPYRIGGWSFGGVIALEVAEKLVQSGRAVELLVMIDTRLPKQWDCTRSGDFPLRAPPPIVVQWLRARASQNHRVTRANRNWAARPGGSAWT